MSKTIPKPPKFPICRIIREGTIGTCQKCGSTEIRKFFNIFGKKIGCIQPECKNYYKKY